MVQDIRTEKVLEELDMTSAQSESALWSILGFYFSIIFGLLAVLILLKTVKIGRFLDFSSSSEESVDAVERKSFCILAARGVLLAFYISYYSVSLFIHIRSRLSVTDRRQFSG